MDVVFTNHQQESWPTANNDMQMLNRGMTYRRSSGGGDGSIGIHVLKRKITICIL